MRSATLFALLVAGSPLSAQRTAGTAAVKELNALFGTLIDALQTRDTATLERIYAPQYSFAIGGGDTVTVLSRAERMAAIVASSENIPRLNVERCDFDVHGTNVSYRLLDGGTFPCIRM
ncbi:MAG: hypothetical protein AB7L66_21760 [Gemmatimonadales bacterium]